MVKTKWNQIVADKPRKNDKTQVKFGKENISTMKAVDL